MKLKNFPVLKFTLEVTFPNPFQLCREKPFVLKKLIDCCITKQKKNSL